MKDRKKLRAIAKEILKLEKRCQKGIETENNMIKIAELTSGLSVEELLRIDNYIQNKLTK